IVHHDFKPDNVLVDGRGRTLVTDFGLAAIVDAGPPTGAGSTSRRNARASSREGSSTARGGTLGYSAPERLAGDAGDARSDQFSWCVTLYEALVGALPFDAPNPDAMLDAMRGGARVVDRRIPRSVRGALQRGLSLDPRDRFPSMDALLARCDRRRLRPGLWALAGVGVGATLLAAAAPPSDDRCTTVADLSGLEDTPTPWVDAVTQRGSPALLVAVNGYAARWQSARVQACRAEPSGASGTAACLDDRRRELQGMMLAVAASADLRDARTDVVAELDDPEDCRGSAPAAEAHVPADPEIATAVERARTLIWGATRLEKQGDSAASLEMADRAAAGLGEIDYGPVWAEIGLARGRALDSLQRPDEAITALEGAVDLAVAHDHDSVATRAATTLIWTHSRVGRLADAKRWGKMAIAYTERTQDPVYLGAIHTSLGNVAIADGDLVEARRHLELALSYQQAELGDGGRGVAGTLQLLASVAQKQGDLAGAEGMLQRSVTLLQGAEGDGSALAYPLLTLGQVTDARGDSERALGYFREARAAGASRSAGPDPLLDAAIADSEGITLRRLGRNADAEAKFRAALAIAKRVFGPEHVNVAKPLGGLAWALHSQGKADEADRAAAQALAILEGKVEEAHRWLGTPLRIRGRVAIERGHYDRAARFLERALAVRRISGAPDHIAGSLWDLAILADRRGDADLMRQRVDEALTTLDESPAVQNQDQDQELRREIVAWLEGRATP
ncbi:MAG: tetratricopeptide repeat-containing protein kinase family protein, partial [Myxococcota bacterium]